MADRGAPPWASWSREQWQAYRDRQAAACERPGWEAWAKNVGRACVAMADYYLKQLEDTCPPAPRTSTPPSDCGTPESSEVCPTA